MNVIGYTLLIEDSPIFGIFGFRLNYSSPPAKLLGWGFNADYPVATALALLIFCSFGFLEG